MCHLLCKKPEDNKNIPMLQITSYRLIDMPPPAAPDGGFWAYMAVFGCFMGNVIGDGVMYRFPSSLVLSFVYVLNVVLQHDLLNVSFIDYFYLQFWNLHAQLQVSFWGECFFAIKLNFLRTYLLL